MTRSLVRFVATTVLVAGAAGVNVGCSHEVSHTESDTPGWFSGSTHKETTVTKNADGSTSMEKKTSETP